MICGNNYKSQTPLSHIKAYGQFFTPLLLSQLMLQYVCEKGPKRVLDPAFGLGVFYSGAQDLLAADFEFRAYELDEKIFDFYCSGTEGFEKSHLDLLNEDYLSCPLDKYDAIVCNPPYIHFQKFLQRHRVIPELEKQLGKKIDGSSNTASLFLLKSLSQLSEGGRLAYVLPFEFFNAGYGLEVKKALLEEGLLKQILVFDNEKEIFPEVTTTICVLLCQKDKKPGKIKVQSFGSLLEVEKTLEQGLRADFELSAEQLEPNKKWSVRINQSQAHTSTPLGFCRLSDYGDVKRGLATGANDFFALNESTLKEFEISKKHTFPCVSKRQMVKGLVFSDEHVRKLAEDDKAIYCLELQEPLDEKALTYVKEGEAKQYHQRFLTQTKNPWYKLEKRESSPLWIGVFNRDGIKVVRNVSLAKHFTCFHSYLPQKDKVRFNDHLFVYLISDLGQKQMRLNQRPYGNDLDKLEPNDLKALSCPSVKQFEAMDMADIKNIIETCKENEQSGIEMANNLMTQFS